RACLAYTQSNRAVVRSNKRTIICILLFGFGPRCWWCVVKQHSYCLISDHAAGGV
ncbi:unnamed protein product, partial [Ectocarpus sp. 8 AP-2014]